MFSRFLTFMAGVHNVPSASFLGSAPPDTVRAAFDQDGIIYPATSSGAPPLRQPLIGNNYAWSLPLAFRRVGYAYSAPQIEAAMEQVATSVAQTAKSNAANCLVVLVHGYNNSVEAAAKNFGQMRAKVASRKSLRPVFLEVYWDGLHRGPLTWPVPLLYWFDAMTYSNLAGQIGLRALLNRRPPELPLLFLTHSRGAGVAFSCITDPVYDSHIRVGAHEESLLRRARAVALVCLAPAVGNGHPLPDVRKALPSNSSLGIGFNTRDPALQKSFIDERCFGDTPFGTDEKAYLEAARAVNADCEWLHRAIYRNYPKHDLHG